MAKAKTCNVYRLQDVFLYTGAYGDQYTDHPDLVAARRALRDACVRVPRGAGGGDLRMLAQREGLKRNFNALTGERIDSSRPVMYEATDVHGRRTRVTIPED